MLKSTSITSSGYQSSNEYSDNRPRSWVAGDDFMFVDGLNILQSDDSVVHGDSLSAASEEELKGILKKRNVVFARITPAHKLQLVQVHELSC